MKPIELTSNRLILRRTRNGDADNLFHYTSDSECSKFLTRAPHAHLEQTQQFLDKWCNLAWDKESDNISWVVSLASNDEAIGLFIVNLEGHKAQIHFGIRKEFWNKGLTTELLNIGVDWLLSSEIVQRVWAVCDLKNIGSFKTLEKSGFKREGILRKWLVLPALSKSARDCYIYSRINEN